MADQLSDDLERYKKNVRKLQDENDELSAEIEDLEEALKKSKRDLEKSVASEQKAQQQLSAQVQDYVQQTEELQADLIQEKLRSNVVAALLRMENTNQAFKDFQNVLYGDFMAFANEESSIADEAQVLLDLQAIEKELQLISAYPEFHTKCTVAVGGGFSVGKSQFISSLFENKDFSLPSDIEPTTALPTFVLDGKQGQLIGVNRQGAKVNLSEIDPQISEKLTHQFMDSFGFPLKSIMPYMFLPTPLAYKHLCFIDTPGYNPASGGQSSTKDDEKTALQYLQDADAVIWLVNINSGTLVASDLQFLRTIRRAKPSVPLYIVANRADQRSRETRKAVLREIKGVLDSAGIQYYGICAYSSSHMKEYIHSKNRSLYSFLQELNHPQPKLDNIIDKIYAIDEHYQKAIWREICVNQRYMDAIEGATFKLKTDNYAKGESKVYDCLEDIAAQFAKQNKVLKQQLATLAQISTSFVDAITQIFNVGKAKKLTTTLKRPVISESNIDTSDIEITKVWEQKSLDEEWENVKKEFEEAKAALKELRETIEDREQKYTNPFEVAWRKLFGS